jgi:hypothetical protein
VYSLRNGEVVLESAVGREREKELLNV